MTKAKRMRTIETTVFQFKELSNAAKEKAREWYRRGLDGDNYFSESVIEDAAEIAAMMGLDVNQRTARLMGGGTRQEPAIYWSGFSSQGDGACLEGTWRAKDVIGGAVAEHVGDSESCREIRRIAAEFARLAAEWPSASFTVSRSDPRYSHEHSVSFDFDISQDATSTEDAEHDLTEASRDFMRWIYRALEQEYNYNRANEQVDESIEANEYEFTEDGICLGAILSVRAV